MRSSSGGFGVRWGTPLPRGVRPSPTPSTFRRPRLAWRHYGRGVDDEPRNAAGDAARAFVNLLPNPDGMEELGRMIADDFVLEDRRRIIGLPSSDKTTFIDGWLAFAHEAGFVANEFEMSAVRGERLALARYASKFDSAAVTEMLIVGLWDVEGPRSQRMLLFDVDALDAAMAELDRLHAEIEADDEQLHAR